MFHVKRFGKVNSAETWLQLMGLGDFVFCRMILSENSATFRDQSLAAPPIAVRPFA